MKLSFDVMADLSHELPALAKVIDDVNKNLEEFGEDSRIGMLTKIGTITAEIPDETTEEVIENVRVAWEKQCSDKMPKLHIVLTRTKDA